MGKKRGGLQALGTFVTGNLGYGLISGNQAHKELGGLNDSDSIAAGQADAARAAEEKKRLEERRRGFLGLNQTAPMGIKNPLMPKRAALGGI